MAEVVSLKMDEAAIDLMDLLVHRDIALSRTDLMHKALCEFAERYMWADRLRGQVLANRDWLHKRRRKRSASTPSQ